MATWKKILTDSISSANSNMLVGNGSTMVAESGATLRTSLGLGTGDTPSFNELNVSGEIQSDGDPVMTEASNINSFGGTDLSVSNGGTGASSASAAATNLGLGTGSNVQFNSIGSGVAASTTQGEGRFTNEVTAYYSSDIALKTNIKLISNPLDKILSLGGYNFDWKPKVIKDRGGEDGFFVRKKDVGILAHEIEKVLPEIVVTRKDGTKAVKYEKLVPLLIESIKELTAKVNRLEDANN